MLLFHYYCPCMFHVHVLCVIVCDNCSLAINEGPHVIIRFILLQLKFHSVYINVQLCNYYDHMDIKFQFEIVIWELKMEKMTKIKCSCLQFYTEAWQNYGWTKCANILKNDTKTIRCHMYTLFTILYTQKQGVRVLNRCRRFRIVSSSNPIKFLKVTVCDPMTMIICKHIL